ncbi:MAG: response regulator receiver protein, partial [Defluviitaleaceae bacterium]|nr:response regulator receiver protein [Defluviitaleaceae bacterium]
MDNTLIVTSSDKGVEYFADALRQAGITQVLTVVSGGEARRRLLERSFDLVVIDFPLQDESG